MTESSINGVAVKLQVNFFIQPAYLVDIAFWTKNSSFLLLLVLIKTSEVEFSHSNDNYRGRRLKDIKTRVLHESLLNYTTSHRTTQLPKKQKKMKKTFTLISFEIHNGTQTTHFVLKREREIFIQGTSELYNFTQIFLSLKRIIFSL